MDAAADDLRAPVPAELLASLPVAVLMIDPAGKIVLANAECELMLNMSERAMAGHSLNEVLTPPEDYRQRDDGHGFAVFEVEIERARGGRIRVDFMETRIADRP